MGKILVHWIITTLAIVLVAWFYGGIEVSGIIVAFLVALVLGIVNAILRPIFLLLTLPINIITLGLFTFIINGLMLWLVSIIVPGFYVAGFWAAVLGSILISIVSMILGMFTADD